MYVTSQSMDWTLVNCGNCSTCCPASSGQWKLFLAYHNIMVVSLHIRNLTVVVTGGKLPWCQRGRQPMQPSQCTWPGSMLSPVRNTGWGQVPLSKKSETKCLDKSPSWTLKFRLKSELRLDFSLNGKLYSSLWTVTWPLFGLRPNLSTKTLDQNALLYHWEFPANCCRVQLNFGLSSFLDLSHD